MAGTALRALCRQQIKRSLEFVIARLPRPARGFSRLILGYHGIRDAGTPPLGELTLHLAADAFSRQLRIAREEADVVALSELLHASGKNARLIAITFDDAYASALRNGVAACSALGLPCTVFVAPALLGTIPPWDALAASGRWSEDQRNRWLEHEGTASAIHANDELGRELEGLRIATEVELQRCLAAFPLLTLGNHTFNHANLGAATPESQHEEVRRAQEWLMSLAGDRCVPCVAYPFGIAPSLTNNLALLPPNGFGLMAHGGSFGPGFPQGRGLVPRWNVPAEVSDNGFRSRVRGRLLPHSP